MLLDEILDSKLTDGETKFCRASEHLKTLVALGKSNKVQEEKQRKGN